MINRRFILYSLDAWPNIELLSPAAVFSTVDVPLWKRRGITVYQRKELASISERRSTFIEHPQPVYPKNHFSRPLLEGRYDPPQDLPLPTHELYRWCETLSGRQLLLQEVRASFQQYLRKIPPTQQSKIKINDHDWLCALQVFYLQGYFDWYFAVTPEYCARCGYGQTIPQTLGRKAWQLVRGKEEKLIPSRCSSCKQETCCYCPRCLSLGIAKSCEPYLLWWKQRATTKKSHSPCTLQWNGTLSPEQEKASKTLQAHAQHLRHQRSNTQSTPIQPHISNHNVIHRLSQSFQRLLSRLPETTLDSSKNKALNPFLVWAVCGAGKTEILFQTLYESLQHGEQVLITSPRRDVIIELGPRLKQAFPHTVIRVLHGESDEKYEQAQLYLATTHQALRFTENFELIVVDEEDAFPYHHDPVLEFAVKRAIKREGTMVYLTATPKKAMQKMANKGKLPFVQVTKRFHEHPLAVPHIQPVGKWRKWMETKLISSEIAEVLTNLIKRQRYAYLFVPRVKDLAPVKAYIQSIILPYITEQEQHKEQGDVEGKKVISTFTVETVHAGDSKRSEIVQQFREHSIRLLITTTILERGVTIPHCDVLVLGSDDPVFDTASLIQMAGRAGRKMEDPVGEVHFFPEIRTKTQVQCIQMIKHWNHLAFPEE